MDADKWWFMDFPVKILDFTIPKNFTEPGRLRIERFRTRLRKAIEWDYDLKGYSDISVEGLLMEAAGILRDIDKGIFGLKPIRSVSPLDYKDHIEFVEES
jgi:hypothetical protein